jgi:hypothetical protein
MLSRSTDICYYTTPTLDCKLFLIYFYGLTEALSGPFIAPVPKILIRPLLYRPLGDTRYGLTADVPLDVVYLS